jgi:dihydroorotase-like cyclic amidohydrolase
MSMVIRGRVFAEGSVRTAAVRVQDGLIVEVSDGDLGDSDEIVELGERQILLPAAIETLAAMRDWAEAARDTVETVTRGALAAGVTVVCDQANTVPRINTPELVQRRAEHVAAHSYSDFAIASHPPRDLDQLDALRAAGAQSLQLFSWDLRPWNEPLDTDDSSRSFRRFAEAGLAGLIFVDEHALRETPLHDQGELYAVRALLRRLDPDFRVRLYVTLPESVEMIAEARERLPNVRIVTTPYNLFVSRERGFARIGLGATQFPPLRSDEAVARMQALAEQGVIDIVMSHHAPHRMGDKYSSDPIPGELTPKAGFSGIDITFPLLLSRLGLANACRLYCEMPARYLGLRKGLIAAGYDADLAIVEEDDGRPDLNIHQHGAHAEGVWKIDPPSMFQSRGLVTPFVGERLHFQVARTYLRGEEAFDRASGRFTRRAVRQVL